MKHGVAWRWLSVAALAILSGSAALAGEGRLAKSDEFGQFVDRVKFGYAHWNAASGDAIDPDGDKGDVDNSFGEHNGKLDKAELGSSQTMAGTVGIEACYALPDNTVSWDFKIPGPGEYIAAFRFDKEMQDACNVTVSYDVGGGWQALPQVMNVPYIGGFGKYVYFGLIAPAGAAKIAMRVKADSGRCYVHRSLLGKKADDPWLPAAEAKPVHPCLYVTAETLPKIKEKLATAAFAEIVKQFQGQCGWYMNTLDRKSDGWTAKYTDDANHHVSRSIAGVPFNYMVFGDKRSFDSIKPMIDVVIGWPKTGDPGADQGQANGISYNVLERGRVNSALAMAYDWMYKDVDEGVRKRWREYMHLEATWNYLYNELCCGDVHNSGNWDPWIGAGYGMIGLALKGEHRWATQWVDSEKEICNVNLRMSQEDYGYFHNGYIKAIDFFACLLTATGENLFEYNKKNLAADVRYTFKHLSPTMDKFPQIGDTDPGRGTPLYFAPIAALLKDGCAQWLMKNLYAPNPREWSTASVAMQAVMVFYDPEMPADDPNAAGRLPLAEALDGTNPDVTKGLQSIVHLRSGYGQPADIQVVFKCGEFSGWHGHPDQASPIITAYGEHLIHDVGKNGGYESPPNNFAKSARSHCNVFIDGKSQASYGEKSAYFHDLSAGKQGKLTHADFVDHIRCDVTTAYQKGNGAIRAGGAAAREFLFVRKPAGHDYIVMIDDVNPGDGAAHAWEWMLQTLPKNQVEPKGNGYYVFKGAAGKAELHSWLLEPQGVTESVATQFNLQGLTVKAGAQANRGIFFAVLYPKGVDMETPEIKRLAGEGFVGASVKGKDVGGEDAVLYATAAGKPVGYGGIETDGRILGVLAGGTYIAVDATYLKKDGKELFKAPKPVTVALDPAKGGVATLAEGEMDLAVTLGGAAKTVKLKAGSTPIEK